MTFHFVYLFGTNESKSGYMGPDSQMVQELFMTFHFVYLFGTNESKSVYMGPDSQIVQELFMMLP